MTPAFTAQAAQTPSWKRLTPEQQKAVSSYAAENGISSAAKQFCVSQTAVRRACALNGVLPPDKRHIICGPEERIRRARAMLRALNVHPSELL